MKQELKLEDINKFHNDFINTKEKEENKQEYSIKKLSLNKERLKDFKYKFNVEIPEVKIYNQQNSYQCNIYAFLRVIKSLLKEEYRNLDLSANYIEFYDKLEKINSLYNCLIKEENLSLEFINEKVDRYIGIYGTFHYCREIVNKYGLVTTKEMPEVSETYNALEMIEFLRANIKKEAILLIGKTKKEKLNLKESLVNKAYMLLSNYLGNPPVKMLFKNKKYTPLAFKNLLLNKNLNDFVTVTTFDKNTFLGSNEFIPNVYLHDSEQILEIDNDLLKKCIINQLEDNVAIWFSAEESTTLDYDINILDDKLYLFEEININKNEQLLLNMINYDHAMAITGALIVNNEPLQYKVDNSFGYHGKYKGHLIMSTSFLENKVITCIIDKKYLS